MFVVVGLIAALILAAIALWVFYVAGNRGRAQDVADRSVAERSQHSSPQKSSRAEGRGDQ